METKSASSALCVAMAKASREQRVVVSLDWENRKCGTKRSVSKGRDPGKLVTTYVYRRKDFPENNR